MASWSRHFDDPIPMPDGAVIKTIGEAARYAEKLPKKIAATAPWQSAARDLLMASEHPAWVFLARIAFYTAVHGDEPVPLGNPKGVKSHRWGKRKLARDR